MHETDPPGPEVAPESSTDQAKLTTYAAQLQFDRPPRSIYHFREQYLGKFCSVVTCLLHLLQGSQRYLFSLLSLQVVLRPYAPTQTF